MTGLLVELRSRQDTGPQWPRFREGAIRDEAQWIRSLSDRELNRLAAGLGQVDRAVQAAQAARAAIPPEKDAA